MILTICASTIYTRDGPREWTELFLSDDSSQLDEDGSLILGADQQHEHRYVGSQ